MTAPLDPRPGDVLALGLTIAELADYGLDATDLRRLGRMTPDRLDRRNRMARLAGLDPARLEGDGALDVATALGCADCADEGRCGRTVAEGAAGEAAAFCGNLDTFRSLAAE